MTLHLHNNEKDTKLKTVLDTEFKHCDYENVIFSMANYTSILDTMEKLIKLRKIKKMKVKTFSNY